MWDICGDTYDDSDDAYFDDYQNAVVYHTCWKAALIRENGDPYRVSSSLMVALSASITFYPGPLNARVSQMRSQRLV